MIDIKVNFKCDGDDPRIEFTVSQLDTSKVEVQDDIDDLNRSVLFDNNPIVFNNLMQSMLPGVLNPKAKAKGQNVYSGANASSSQIKKEEVARVHNFELNRYNRSISSGSITLITKEPIAPSTLMKGSEILITFEGAFKDKCASQTIHKVYPFIYQGLITSVAVSRLNDQDADADIDSDYCYEINFTSDAEFLFENRKLYMNFCELEADNGFENYALTSKGKDPILADPKKCAESMGSIPLKFFRSKPNLIIKSNIHPAVFYQSPDYTRPINPVSRNVNYILNGLTYIDFLRSPLLGDRDFMLIYSENPVYDNKGERKENKVNNAAAYLNPSTDKALGWDIEEPSSSRDWTVNIQKCTSSYSENLFFNSTDASLTASVFFGLSEYIDGNNYYYAPAVKASSAVKEDEYKKKMQDIVYFLKYIDEYVAEYRKKAEFDCCFILGARKHAVAGFKFCINKTGMFASLFSTRFHERKRLAYYGYAEANARANGKY